MTSNAHNFGANFNPDNLNSEIQYDRMKAYPNTKLYNVRIKNEFIVSVDIVHVIALRAFVFLYRL